MHKPGTCDRDTQPQRRAWMGNHKEAYFGEAKKEHGGADDVAKRTKSE